MTNVGDGWYRCTMTYTTSTGTYVYVFASDSLSSARTASTSSTGNFYVWGAQLNEGTLKDYQKTETRLNIPRLDYSNGTCPSILVEPQRTNLLTWSSSFDNAAWVKNNATITANNTTAPDGTMTADKVVVSANTDNVIQTGLPFVGVGNSNTISLYIKGSGSNIGKEVGLYIDREGGGTYEASTVVGVLTAEWQRIEVTHTWVNSQSSVRYKISQAITTTPASEFFIWGAQLEAGSYATSYIPTTSASVTRNADVISKTGISSLIGQTEGTIFIDVDFDNLASQTNNPVLFSLFGNATIYLQIFTSGYGELIYSTGAGTQAYLYWSGITNGHHKIALGYKANDFVLYVDGIQVATDTTGSVDTLSSFYFGYNNSSFNPTANYKATALWKTRLTNTQLAQLTTI